MKNFIKENWFKIAILITLVFFSCVYFLSNRYYFMHIKAKDNLEEKNVIIKCDKFTGNCQREMSSEWFDIFLFNKLPQLPQKK